MTTSLTTNESRELSRYTPAQRELIRRTIAHDATDDELALFIAAAEHMRLDIFARQIYCTIYNKHDPAKRRLVLVTGIDGYRARAEDSGAFAGTDATWFDCCGIDGNCRGKPKVAKTTVYKIVQGQRVPFVGVARWEEFYNKNNAEIWDRSPHNQLGKCSEAQAIRRGFQRAVTGLDFAPDPPGVDPTTGEIIDASWQNAPAQPIVPTGLPAPSESQRGASNRLLVMCPDHDTDWYRKGSMRTYAHKDGDLWCNRPAVLSRLMKTAREQAEVSEDEAKDYYKATFGKPPSQLTDEQRVTAIEHFEGLLTTPLPFDDAIEPDDAPWSEEVPV